MSGWGQSRVRRETVIIVRYADDFIAGFQHTRTMPGASWPRCARD